MRAAYYAEERACNGGVLARTVGAVTQAPPVCAPPVPAPAATQPRRRLPVLSPSQVELHLLCPRKRFIKNALRVPEAQSPSAAVGDRVHVHSDNYLDTGELPDGSEVVEYSGKYSNTPIKKYPGRIFMNGRGFLPPPGTAVSEGKFKMVSPAGITWMGARDWVRRPVTDPNAVVTSDYFAANYQTSARGLLLGDNKTTSSPVYAKDYAELLSDVQGNLYAHELLTNPFSAPYKALPPNMYGRWLPDHVPSRWVYYLTEEAPNAPKRSWATKEQLRKWESWKSANRPLAWGVEVNYYPDKVAKRVAEIDQIGLEIIRIQESTTNPVDVPANLDACEAFGGCAFRGTEHCRLSTADVYNRQIKQFDQHQENQSMNAAAPAAPATLDPLAAAMARAAEMRAAQAAANPAAVVAPPVVAPAPAPAAPPVVAAPPPPPAYWQPGDALNEAQAFLAHSAQTLRMVANAAGVPQEVWQGWPGYDQPYTTAMNDSIAVARAQHTPVGVPEAVRINPPVGEGGVTQAARNPEEHQALYEKDKAAQGLTVPPAVADQAPVVPASAPAPVAPAAPVGPAASEAEDREAVREACISLGIVDPESAKPITKSSRHSTERLRKFLAAQIKASIALGRLDGNLSQVQAALALAAQAPAAPPPAAPVVGREIDPSRPYLPEGPVPHLPPGSAYVGPAAPPPVVPAPVLTPREQLAVAFEALAGFLRNGGQL